MNVAVVTLTRDRLSYSKHCFASLQANAGCDYDHYVIDQASDDGTDAWLDAEYEAGRILAYSILHDNVGICKALNLALNEEFNPADYDVIVRFDNDCEVTQDGTLRTVCEVACEYNAIVAPHVLGLRNPPAVTAHHLLGDHVLDKVHHLGGIFMAIPAALFSDHGFRYDERQPPWAGDELICPWWTAQGGLVGYLDGWNVNHYLGTDGQVADNPDYFQRRVLEGGPAR